MAKNKKVTSSANSRRNDNGMRIIIDENKLGSKGLRTIATNVEKLGGKIIKF